MDPIHDTTQVPKPSMPAQDIDQDSLAEYGEPLVLRLTRIVRSLWVRRRMMFTIVGIGMLLSLAYALVRPADYTSTTSLMPPDNSSSTGLLGLLSSAGSPAAAVGNALVGAKTPGAVFVGVLNSHTVQEDLVNQFDLVHYYSVRYPDDACKELAAHTHVGEDQKSGIITISVDAKDPALASKLAQSYVEELDHVMTHNSTSAALRESEFLQGRLHEIKQDLDSSALALSQFSSKNRTIDVASQAKAMVDAGLKMQAELGKTQAELASLRQVYSEDNMQIRAAKARVAELVRQIAKINGPVENAQNGAASNNSSGSPYPSIEELPGLGLASAELERKVKVDEALWEALTKQFETAKVQAAKDIPTVRILDAANVPQRKSNSRSFLVIVGTLLSFVIACIAVLIASAWSGTSEDNEQKQLIREIAASMPLWLRSMLGIN